MKLVGADPLSAVRGRDPLAGKVHYFRGRRPARLAHERAGLRPRSSRAGVIRASIWSTTARKASLRSTYTVAPGADVSLDFPTDNAVRPQFGGGIGCGDAFVAKLTADGQALI